MKLPVSGKQTSYLVEARPKFGVVQTSKDRYTIRTQSYETVILDFLLKVLSAKQPEKKESYDI